MRARFAFLLVLAGCGNDRPAESTGTGPRPENVAALVTIPAGTLRVGSVPGTVGRVASAEAARVPVSLDEFAIERAPRATSTAHAEAARQCAAVGRRLCTELEWERACAGEAGHPFATGPSLDVARCASEACASQFGVESLGTRAAEWTADTVTVSGRTLAVVRGGTGDDAAPHRCAARRFVDPSSRDPGLAFRCCEGDPNEARYPAPTTSSTPYARADVDATRARAILASVPELAPYAAAFRLYSDPERAAVVARGAARTPPVNLAPEAIERGILIWSPVPHVTAWVFVGRSGPHAVVAVLYPLGDGSFVHGASLVMQDESNAVVLVRRDPASKSLGFSTCLSCGGEDGEINYRDDGRIVVVTR